MNKNWKKTSIVSLMLAMLMTGCLAQKSSNKRTETTNTSTNTGTNTGGTIIDPGENTGGGYGDGNEPGIPDAGQTQDYYSINNIMIHGKGNIQGAGYANPDYLWSSLYGVGSSDQHIFYTNSRFNVRIRAQGGGSSSDNVSAGAHEYESGKKCVATNYDKLEVTLCLRSKTGSCIYTHTFSDIPIGQVSKTKEFSVPYSTDPLVVEVIDVKYDFTCESYKAQGYSESSLGSYCPYYGVSWSKCAKIDIQFSTDTTKDLPGERY